MFPKFEIRSSWWLAAAAAICGAVAFFGAQSYLGRTRAALEAQWRGRFAGVGVVVAATDLPSGRVLRAEDLARREVPKAYVPSGTFAATDLPSLVGRQLLQPMRRGDPLVGGLLSGEAGPALAARLRAGTRAVTVPVDEVSSQAGLVRPGDKVDLMLAEEHQQGLERCISVRPLLESLRVLATGRAQNEIAQGGGSAALRAALAQPDGRYSTITLDVTPEQAQQLAVGLRVGELIPMLRADGDAAPTRLSALGAGRVGCRVATTARVTADRSPGHSVELMVGGESAIARSRLAVPEL